MQSTKEKIAHRCTTATKSSKEKSASRQAGEERGGEEEVDERASKEDAEVKQEMEMWASRADMEKDKGENVDEEAKKAKKEEKEEEGASKEDKEEEEDDEDEDEGKGDPSGFLDLEAEETSVRVSDKEQEDKEDGEDEEEPAENSDQTIVKKDSHEETDALTEAPKEQEPTVTQTAPATPSGAVPLAHPTSGSDEDEIQEVRLSSVLDKIKNKPHAAQSAPSNPISDLSDIPSVTPPNPTTDPSTDLSVDPAIVPSDHPHISLINASAFMCTSMLPGSLTFTLDLNMTSASAGSAKLSKPVDLSFVPSKYHNFADVSSKSKANKLPPHCPYDLKINLKEGTSPPVSTIYLLLQVELQVLQEFIDKNLAIGFICLSTSLHGAPVLFVCKKDVAFQCFMNNIFNDLLDVCITVYLDDILIYLDDIASHKDHVREVLCQLRKHGLFAHADKCKFHQDKVEYLGYILSTNGLTMSDNKVKIIQEWPKPHKVKDIQSFLGFTNFYCCFIYNYSDIVIPLTWLT
ncbi:hypothetical protein NP233_g12624 [Leucocoprinus birnbaumii]|uniref:Reverse transcriptase domain-containing protein n=1 Tax=Leucocoprinus birnbaumii TaxID=56174 RepID=A0AAD5VE70_9AGAR|nr:hypothetical protein NP233_g12624 [Leucocoprinus birnbaumii]